MMYTVDDAMAMAVKMQELWDYLRSTMRNPVAPIQLRASVVLVVGNIARNSTYMHVRTCVHVPVIVCMCVCVCVSIQWIALNTSLVNPSTRSSQGCNKVVTHGCYNLATTLLMD